MKKLLIPMLMAIFTYATSIAETNAHIILQHKGQITMFDYTEGAAAMEQAVDGDSILFSKGSFDQLTITKSVTVRGEGNNRTSIKGITIDGGDNTISPTIEGIRLGYYDGTSFNNMYNIYLTKNTDNLKIKACDCHAITCNTTDGGQHNNLIVEKTFFNYEFYPQSVISSAKFTNCYFSRLDFRYSMADFIFINCDANSMDYVDNARSTFINCRLYRNSSYRYTFQKSTLINCILGGSLNWMTNDCYAENCWSISANPCDYSTDALIEKGYIGNDGTVVGRYGGSSPYTLKLGIPRVSSSKIILDNETKTLNVDVTFESN